MLLPLLLLLLLLHALVAIPTLTLLLGLLEKVVMQGVFGPGSYHWLGPTGHGPAQHAGHAVPLTGPLTLFLAQYAVIWPNTAAPGPLWALQQLCSGSVTQ
jgi:hypothetical protein